MAGKRSYQLLCPIARTLDVVGDRWALLILRDLHAGPARFRELESGLGIATNLLSSRLTELVENGLVAREPHEGQHRYVLTEVGAATDRILWELTRFGRHLDPDEVLRRPGNLRTVVLPLRFALLGLPERPHLAIRFVVDDEPFTVHTSPTSATVDYGDRFAGSSTPDVEVRTDYEALIDVGDGRLDPDVFLDGHVQIVGDQGKGEQFLMMVAAAFATGAD